MSVLFFLCGLLILKTVDKNTLSKSNERSDDSYIGLGDFLFQEKV